MKTNNQHLENINENLSGQTVDVRKSNNWYLRSIAKNTGSSDIHGYKTDNFYLKRISENIENMDIGELNAIIHELRQEVEDLTYQTNNEIIIVDGTPLIQKDDDANMSVYCKVDGTKLVNETVYFYEVID